MTMNQSEHPPRTALVLGGGGSTGNAWLIGVIAGLADSGVDVTGADILIGTSAGATAAAQLAGERPSALYEQTVSIAGPVRSGPRVPQSRPVVNHLERTARIIADARDVADMRRRMGEGALELSSAADPTERWRATVGARLRVQTWPKRAMLITAVDASTGEPVVFDRESGVDLVDAVAASTSGGAAYRIGDRWYIDGGYRTNADNADLAAGCELVLVLSPFGGRTRLPARWGLRLADQVAALRAAGSRVETIFPDPEYEHLFGVDGMDLSLRPQAARVGHAEGRARAGGLGWFLE